MGDVSKKEKENRQHQRILQNNGHWAEIIEYKDSEHITFLWDNKIISHGAYKRFRDGLINYNKNCDICNCIGDKRTQKNNHIAEIIDGRHTGDIDVHFEDGTVVFNTTYHKWETGNITYPASYDDIRKKHIGESKLQKNGYIFVIDVVDNTNAVHGHFLDDYNTKTTTTIKIFNKGTIPHPCGSKIQIQQRNERLGSSIIQHNGLALIIDRYDTSQDCGGHFEDGTPVVKFKYNKALNGFIGHPTLSSFGNGTYMNFKTFPAFTDNGKVYYKCMCKKCSIEDILTPQQMIEHYNMCNKKA